MKGVEYIEKIWDYKDPDTLTDREKNQILEKLFDAIVENEMYDVIGEEITDYVTSNGYVFEEEIED